MIRESVEKRVSCVPCADTLPRPWCPFRIKGRLPLQSLSADLFYPKLPHLGIFVISFVWGLCIEVRIRWRSSARTLGVRRTECHTHFSHLIPVLASTSFAAHVKHHVLSDSIPFPVGLYVCVPLSCLDVKVYSRHEHSSSRPTLLPSLPTFQVPHRPIFYAEPSLFGTSSLSWHCWEDGPFLLAGSSRKAAYRPRIDNVTPENGLRVRLHPSKKTISYTFLVTRQDLFIGFRQS